MHSVLSRAFLLLILAFTSPAYAEFITARVVAVHDGDTITALTTHKEQIKVRLAEIDAPELAQPYGKKSKQELSSLVFSKTVTLLHVTTDKYGRTVARVYQDAKDINFLMVQEGAAWAYRTYLTDSSILDAETQARNAHKGLWALQPDQIMPPWEWRNGRKKNNSAPTETPAHSSTLDHSSSCNGKTLCRQMEGCAEARFYLTHCGLISLDRDHDGIPCENLCP